MSVGKFNGGVRRTVRRALHTEVSMRLLDVESAVVRVTATSYCPTAGVVQRRPSRISACRASVVTMGDPGAAVKVEVPTKRYWTLIETEVAVFVPSAAKFTSPCGYATSMESSAAPVAEVR